MMQQAKTRKIHFANPQLSAVQMELAAATAITGAAALIGAELHLWKRGVGRGGNSIPADQIRTVRMIPGKPAAALQVEDQRDAAAEQSSNSWLLKRRPLVAGGGDGLGSPFITREERRGRGITASIGEGKRVLRRAGRLHLQPSRKKGASGHRTTALS